MKTRTLEELKSLTHTATVNSKCSLTPSQTNRKPHTKNLATSVPITQYNMSVSNNNNNSNKKLQGFL